MNLKQAAFYKEDNQLKVTFPAEVIEHFYDYDFLLSQKATLESELQKVNDLLGEADKLGIESRVEMAVEEGVLPEFINK